MVTFQVNSKANDKELDRWCKANIILYKEDHYYVEYLDSDGKDLVQYDTGITSIVTLQYWYF
jgi:hypothetical protein